MKDTTTTDFEPLRAALATIDLEDLLTNFAARERVGVRYQEIAKVGARFGLEFRQQNGNVYGPVMLASVSTTPGPVLRLITRSDHAAVHGIRRAA